MTEAEGSEVGSACDWCGLAFTNAGSYHHVKVHADRRTVTYVGSANHLHDVGCVRTNLPCPRDTTLFYYEITVVDQGSGSGVACGIAGVDFKMNRQPGTMPASVGYDSSGEIVCTKGHAVGAAPVTTKTDSQPYATGDTVGCGMVYRTGVVFFTCNGELVGNVWNPRLLGAATNGAVEERLWPVVGLHSPNAVVSGNFGQDDFCFDIVSAKAAILNDLRQSIQSAPSPSNSGRDLICDYLRHKGYGATLNAIESSGPHPKISKLSRGMVDSKTRLRGLIQNAKIEEAQQLFGELLHGRSDTDGSIGRAMARLGAQQLVERVKCAGCQQAIGDLLPHLRTLREKDEDTINEVMGLLAFADPSTSPVAHLLSDSYRLNTADVVIDALNHQERGLAHSGDSAASAAATKTQTETQTAWPFDDQSRLEATIIQLDALEDFRHQHKQYGHGVPLSSRRIVELIDHRRGHLQRE